MFSLTRVFFPVLVIVKQIFFYIIIYLLSLHFNFKIVTVISPAMHKYVGVQQKKRYIYPPHICGMDWVFFISLNGFISIFD
uniref:Uncharacterized protein n=1 Tax=Anguilla anguilla TaxID=7936 RepID=A0A0E9WW06_ANGAN